MHHIVYSSQVVGELSEGLLREMLVQFRTKNRQADITGILLYCDGQVLQVLEGERAVIEQLYGQIERDWRHSGVVKLADGPVSWREFPEWSMAFAVASPATFASLAGYCNPDNPWQPRNEAGRLVRELIREFIQQAQLTV
ncbi:BLUF domain-containing protein [Hymenobacter actinosclerus]|uniref:Sensors of blue-light using FAD n=1 Tax=Hymenobacter actinosclerus TaxID=82805 RepID=A0A1I0BHT7_9BACT|nr:BLUF domain-containing protein [Hymenobacter actinosclerus]SET06555.1 Sensors of blue-light using FAD [Hymenobacter actinosclerus]